MCYFVVIFKLNRNRASDRVQRQCTVHTVQMFKKNYEFIFLNVGNSVEICLYKNRNWFWNLIYMLWTQFKNYQPLYLGWKNNKNSIIGSILYE
jgi:hypothetical protein